jgi:serine/threonine protein phosphatase PrpC
MSPEIEAAVVTHTGRVRTHNEDYATYVRPSDAAVLRSRGVLAVVADGMGGHNAGEHASRLTVDTIARSYFQSTDDPGEALDNAISEANLTVYVTARANSAMKGMGTTCVAVAVCDEKVWWAWVGDSRLYLLRDGKTYRLTEDHTVVQEMVRNGWMTREEAQTHHDRNVLERAIGTRKTVSAGVSEAPLHLQAGDRLLLCSDGLHDLLGDEEIAALAGKTTVTEGAEQLLQTALMRGGHDNVSVVLLEVKDQAVPKQPVQTREHELV